VASDRFLVSAGKAIKGSRSGMIIQPSKDGTGITIRAATPEELAGSDDQFTGPVCVVSDCCRKVLQRQMTRQLLLQRQPRSKLKLKLKLATIRAPAPMSRRRRRKKCLSSSKCLSQVPMAR